MSLGDASIASYMLSIATNLFTTTGMGWNCCSIRTLLFTQLKDVFFLSLRLKLAIRSVEDGLLSWLLFVVFDASNSFCKMSMIVRAEPSSSKASFSRDSYTLHLLLVN